MCLGTRNHCPPLTSFSASRIQLTNSYTRRLQGQVSNFKLQPALARTIVDCGNHFIHRHLPGIQPLFRFMQSHAV